MIQDELQAFAESKPYQIPLANQPLIYHYTNAQSLINIIESGHFWASKSDFLNDRSELIYMEFIFITTCQKMLSSGNYADSRFQDFIDNSTNFLKANHFPIEIYLISFSDNHDSLTLWSNYSKFNGYNIGIELNVLNDVVRPYRGFVGKVIYDHQEQERIVWDEIYHFFKFWIDHGSPKNMMFEVISKLMARIKLYSVFFKHPTLKNEEEFRAGFIRFPNEEFSNIKFRARNDLIIPYIEISVLSDGGLNPGKMPLQSITIGPTNQSDIAEIGLKNLLSKTGYNYIKIMRSNIPLRY